jgi:hypothetical protein
MEIVLDFGDARGMGKPKSRPLMKLSFRAVIAATNANFQSSNGTFMREPAGRDDDIGAPRRSEK